MLIIFSQNPWRSPLVKIIHDVYVVEVYQNLPPQKLPCAFGLVNERFTHANVRLCLLVHSISSHAEASNSQEMLTDFWGIDINELESHFKI